VFLFQIARQNLPKLVTFTRSQLGFAARLAQAGLDALSRPFIVRQFRKAVKPITTKPRRAPSGFGDVDPTAAGRAAAASAAISARYAGLIE
jgi:hypothetical protein